MSAEGWLVFGRTAYGEPLTERGTLTEGSPHAALDAYGGEWIELVLVPVAELRWIIRAGEAAA